MGHGPRGLLAARRRRGTTSRTTTPASRAYRWGEDGLLGISDNHQRLCFALALWNGRDPILKERLFGLTGPEGNHGEDVKECYFYLDATPTHSYMRALYKYPQGEYPVRAPRRGERAARARRSPSSSSLDTGVFDDDRYFDVLRRVREGEPERRPGPRDRREPRARRRRRSTCCRRSGSGTPGPGSATRARPRLRPARGAGRRRGRARRASRALAGVSPLRRGDAAACSSPRTRPTSGASSATARPTPGGRTPSTRRSSHGRERPPAPRTRRAPRSRPHYRLDDPAGRPDRRCGSGSSTGRPPAPFGPEFDRVVRRAPAGGRRVLRDGRSRSGSARTRGASCARRSPGCSGRSSCTTTTSGAGSRAIPAQPPPPPERRHGRNAEWTHLYNDDVVSMPDKWEYPWYAAWDLAFHTIALALVDPDFAKEQLILFLREWYMHPNGQIPAYEWAFGDVNPPVHAWAAWRVYKIERRIRGRRRPALPRARLPEAPPELHLVGEPQGPRGEERLRRAASSGSTTSGSSTARRRCPPAATSSSPTARRGSACTA